MSPRQVYNIPAGNDFAKTLARSLLAETKGQPEKLASYLILLPTRRACRTLERAFFDVSDNDALLLPRLQPLGDVEEEELSLSLTDEKNLADLLALSPAMPPLRRQLELATLVRAIDPDTISAPQSLALADALARLLDQVHIEELDFSQLEKLVPAEFAEYWQITTRFLEILREAWPKILETEHMTDAARRRRLLMDMLGAHWQKNPPAYPVIAAGSTGSIPATARLLNIIAGLPNGKIILPGLDADMDDESWAAIEDTHPQASLRQLLEHLDIGRGDVKLWPGADNNTGDARRFLAREIMRPAAVTEQWSHLATSKASRTKIEGALKNLSLLECANEREEAQAIALLLREVLTDENATAVLVTPDRALARRVAGDVRAWDITLDDSAGRPLSETPPGIFLRLVLAAARASLAPVALLSLLKHPFCGIAQMEEQAIDLALRGLKPAPGLTGLAARLGNDHALLKALTPCFTKIPGRTAESFENLLTWHLEAAEHLAAANMLWNDEDGEEAAKLFASLREQSSLMPAMTLTEYEMAITSLLRGKTTRPAFGTHPRLQILGQLESRLVQADLVILGGLNEGTWPPETPYDPWMSRPMKKTFGLPSPERGVALAAHDFVQGFCAPRVVLTRARKKEGAPTVPARWLQRLSAVLQAAQLPPLDGSDALHWARAMHRASEFTPVKRPAPTPPVDQRPRGLFATRIETWLKDPYSIYARYILDLEKLKPFEQEAGAAERGSFLHKVLNEFTALYPKQLPPGAENILLAAFENELRAAADDAASWSFWRPRLRRIAARFIELATGWRARADFLRGEITGQTQIDAAYKPFTLSAKADRIDKMGDGGAVIDYKSSGDWTPKKITSGEYPQLALEALILAGGGFPGIGALPPHSLSYWKLTGASDAGEIIEATQDLGAVLAQTREGLQALINAFDNADTPYLSLPHADRLPRFNDYEHLARVREWAALGDDLDEGSEAA